MILDKYKFSLNYIYLPKYKIPKVNTARVNTNSWKEFCVSQIVCSSRISLIFDNHMFNGLYFIQKRNWTSIYSASKVTASVLELYDFPSALVYRFFSLSCNICSGFPLEHLLVFKFMIHIVNLLTSHSIWNLYLTFWFLVCSLSQAKKQHQNQWPHEISPTRQKWNKNETI